MSQMKRFMVVLVVSLAVAGAAAPSYATPAPARENRAQGSVVAPLTPAPIVRAERAFAADGLAMGVDRSFLAHSTADAVMLNNAPVLARDVLNPNAVFDEAAPKLAWFPLWAGIARSGDLGFTTGPVEVGGRRRGHYFTVWQKQADGEWRWVYDGGVGATSEGEPNALTEPTYLAVARSGAGSSAAAMTEVTAAEAAFSDLAKVDSHSAYLSILAPDARLYVVPLPPARSPTAFEQALQSAPLRVDFGPPLGGGASSAGDLVWVYGPVSWTLNDVASPGHYVRVWQHQSSGWRVVFAEVVPARP